MALLLWVALRQDLGVSALVQHSFDLTVLLLWSFQVRLMCPACWAKADFTHWPFHLILPPHDVYKNLRRTRCPAVGMLIIYIRRAGCRQKKTCYHYCGGTLLVNPSIKEDLTFKRKQQKNLCSRWWRKTTFIPYNFFQQLIFSIFPFLFYFNFI